MVKPVLMVAFHFPPLRGSSGIQRTLKFAQYLPRLGWRPIVLSAHPRAYANQGDDQLRDIPAEAVVKRAFAIDSSVHLAFKGRYSRLLALPDRWVGWLLGAVPAGLGLVRKYRPAVLWSTYPISTAHVIGLVLHRLTGLPWVADMRDPMTDTNYPPDPLTRRLFGWIERQTISHCCRLVCTTPGTVAKYRARFPQVPPARFVLIENGYDEENFAEAASLASVAPLAGRPFVLVHSGIVYPSERDPTQLFEALAELLRQAQLVPSQFQLLLRATANDAHLGAMISQHGIGSIVTLAPHLPYRDALAEMLGADGLLVLQATNCNHQVPAKLYEYLRARRPVLALTDPVGDTAATLRDAGIDSIAPLDSKDAIMAAIMQFLARARAGSAPVASDARIASHSRGARAGVLAALLDEVVRQHSTGIGEP
jgi:glycosyltransferase involved in cell wall biosynthesis